MWVVCFGSLCFNSLEEIFIEIQFEWNLNVSGTKYQTKMDCIEFGCIDFDSFHNYRCEKKLQVFKYAKWLFYIGMDSSNSIYDRWYRYNFHSKPIFVSLTYILTIRLQAKTT